MTEQTRIPKWFLAVAITLGIIAVGLTWFWRQPQQRPAPIDPPPPPSLPEQQARRLLDVKNRGIGLLENGRYEEAANAFQQIISELPEEPLGRRNLAITRVLAVMQLTFNDFTTEPARFAKLRRLADAALEIAIQTEPQSAVPHVLSARLANHLAELDPTGDDWRQKEIAALSEATTLDPDAAHLWLQLYQVRKLQRDKAARDSSIDALNRAYRLRPQNLAVLVEWLKNQARRKDPDVVSTLRSAGEIVSLIAARLRKENSQYDLRKMHEDAIAGVQANKPDAWGTIVELANILGSRHATKLDRREMSPHLLEFTLLDFSEKFYNRAVLPDPKQPPGIPVALKPAAGDRRLPRQADVHAIKSIDFDLDGRNDVIVLTENRLAVFSLQQAQGEWKLLVEKELPFAASGFIAVDLDFDVHPSTPAANTAAAKSAIVRQTKPVPAKRPRSALGAKTKPDSRCSTADVDLVVWGPGGMIALRNDVDPQTGNRQLNRIQQPAGFQKLKDVITLAAADFDHDSDLDLIVSTKHGMALWTNRGDMTFTDVTEFSQLPQPAFQPSAVVPIDFDRNVFTDVVLGSSDAPRAGYLQNIGHGQLRFKKFDATFASLGHAGVLRPIDADGNASWDWVAAGPQGITLTRTRTVGHSRYQFLKSTTIDKNPVDGAQLWDYDNDGYEDVLAWSKDGFHVYRGGPGGVFQRTTGLFAGSPKRVTSVSVADIDHDGDLDVVAVVGGKPVLFYNEGGNKNNWIDVALHAQDDPLIREQRCNIHGVGSLLELKAGPLYQARVVTDPNTHFGLGSRKTANVLRVLWTNGIPQNLLDPKTRQSICSPQELLKGSCPYLYTWNGTHYEFFTDLLWAAPIGLQFADGVIARPREWEYLKIPGEKLAPVDGEYRMQITEELWEAGYFDSVKLYAIDHPADVEIFTNEKVGPAAIAKLKVHTVRKPRIPIAARDQTGRDVLPLVAKRDDRFTQSYSGRLTQGLTREHYLELDLGKLKRPRNIMLFLTGWVFPSDTSINVWLSQHPHLPAPRPPSVWVPDANGRWKETIPFMGFPGGKTKTIAVDLSKAFLTDDYRLQIRTTMELRWDAAFFTVDEKPAQYRMTELPLKNARLSYRGFSKRINRPHRAPESYDFHTVDKVPHWPPMAGRFTRFGVVTDLIRRDDDRLVVMGAGDTMALRFGQHPDKPIDPPLPPGWKRDFFIRNVGWDKDADLNTVLGQTVEPLPYRAMSSYPFGPRDTPPNSKAYSEYLRRFQTRKLPAADFWRALQREPETNRRPQQPTGNSKP